LQAATLNPARFFGIEDHSGTVETGRRADLVLLNANPLADIANTQQIAAVIVNGRYLSSKELQKLLDRVEAAARD
jgi:imidazolonepropionase-like amidohydrolase